MTNEKINKYIETLSKELGVCKRAFSLYDTYLRLMAPNIQSEEHGQKLGREIAGKNEKSIEHYRYFFDTAIHNSLLTTLSTLSKIFVPSKGSIGIQQTLKSILQNIDKLNTEALVGKNCSFKKEDITKDIKTIEAHKKNIIELKEIRNKYLAHLDKKISPKDLTIATGVIKNLIGIGTAIIERLENQSGMELAFYDEDNVGTDFIKIIKLINKSIDDQSNYHRNIRKGTTK